MVPLLSIGFAALFTGAAWAVPPCDPQKLVQIQSQWNILLRTGEIRNFFSKHPDFVYKQNDQITDIREGIISQALEVSANRAYYDSTLCKIWTEHVVTNPAHPYVINTQIYVVDGAAKEIDALVTDEGDFSFNATVYKDIGYSQKWDFIPESERSTREYLKDAGDAYFEHLHSRAPFPVRVPCMVLSGGFDSSKGNTSVDTCTHQPYKPDVPIQTMINRRYLIDEKFGVINIFTQFTGLDRNHTEAKTPDSHLFRVENGTIRYIHVAAACITPNCGWPPHE